MVIGVLVRFETDPGASFVEDNPFLGPLSLQTFFLVNAKKYVQ